METLGFGVLGLWGLGCGGTWGLAFSRGRFRIRWRLWESPTPPIRKRLQSRQRLPQPPSPEISESHLTPRARRS